MRAMQPNVAAAVVLFALLLCAVLRWHASVPVTDATEFLRWPTPRKGEDQLPEPVRAARRSWPVGLSAAVALVALFRIALLVTLHA